MRPETLLAKFNLKGISYDESRGGKGLMAVEEQLAAVGIVWKQSPTGFLILFVEALNDQASARLLYTACLEQANRQMKDWKGQRSELAVHALVVTAIYESTNPMGRLCPECGGSGSLKNKYRHLVNCPNCDKGKIRWTLETRFAAACTVQKGNQHFATTFSRFKKYHEVLLDLNKWLADKRNAAMLALIERIESEKEAAKVS